MTLIKICSGKSRFSQSGGHFFKISPGTLDSTTVGPPTSVNIWHLHFFKRLDGPGNTVAISKPTAHHLFKYLQKSRVSASCSCETFFLYQKILII